VATVELALPNGSNEVVTLAGPTTVHVTIGPNGECADTDGDGWDQAATEITQMQLTGASSLGPVVLRLREATKSPFRRSLGEMEELVNYTLGIMDVPPFAAVGQAESVFDVYFQVEVAGLVLHNETRKRMWTIISHKPPEPGATYEDPAVIELYDEDNNPVGVKVLRTAHTPTPLACPPLLAQLVPGTSIPGGYDVMVCWKDDERCRLQWTRDLNAPIRWRDWTGPIITQPDGTKCVRIADPRGMMYFRLCGGCPALGE